jgi:FAD/FMN-containing dehydrogenase
MSSKSSPRKKRAALASILIAPLALGAGKIIYDYGTAPTKEKDCDFVFPVTADQTTPTAISARPSERPVSVAQRGGTINDASCLNKTVIHSVVRVSSIDDVRNALQFARDNKLKVTAAGQRHSMGGQSFTRGGLVLDMRSFAAITLDKERRIVKVQAGATCEKVQQALDREGLAMKAMQSINIFTVGGTLSVNAHGIAHSPGPVAPTVKSIRIMLSSGEIKKASPSENRELFRHALGGYGLFGVILDADIEVVDNEMYRWDTRYVSYKDFPEDYKNNVEGNSKIGLMYARLSVAPTSYLDETAVHTYARVPYDHQELPRLQPEGHT